jgi:hypothetical protein
MQSRFRRRLVPFLAGLLMLLLGASAAGAARPFPDTRSGVYVFTDQLPSNPTAGQWSFIASHYVGTQKERVSWTRYIRTLNPAFIVLHYQLALGAGPADFVVGDTWTNDFSYVTTQEPWFLHDGAGSRILQTYWNWNVMNIVFNNGVPASGWPDYWNTTAVDRLRLNENDGVFADSYTQDILFGQVSPPYIWFNDVNSCLTNWIPNLNQYGAYCASYLHSRAENFYYLPNLGGLVNSWDTTNYSVGDGGMCEGFALSGPGSYYALGDWQLQMNRILTLQNQGKIVIGQSYISDSSINDRWFVLGSYLLTKGHKSFVNMFQSSTLSWYPEYKVNLGDYTAEPAANVSSYWNASWGVYRRDYANGFVLVNPGSGNVMVRLGGSKRLVNVSGGGPVGTAGTEPGTLTTSNMTKVTVPAHSARVLLN